MNINPKTGKIWVNNYLNMYGTIFANQNHKYIQLDRYYDIIGKLEGRTKAGYAMILHNHIAQITCNRSPGVHANIFMYIDSRKGHISNSKEMKEWMCSTGWMNCNGKHLLDIASNEVWWVVYKAMLDLGLITASSGVLRVMIPIEGRFLPIPYAHVAFLSRVKRDSELSNAVVKAIADTPDKIRTNLKDLPKEELIDELVKMKTKDLIPSKNSEVYKMLFEEIQAKHPHQWGKDPGKKRNNFLEEIQENFSEIIPKNNPEKIPEKKVENNPENNLENISENIPGINSVEKIVENIPEKISQDKIQKEKSKPKRKKLLPEDIHNFESNKKLRGPRNCPEKKSEEIAEEIAIDTQLFFADDVTPHDAQKVTSEENSTEKIPENNFEENFQDLSEFDIEGDDHTPDMHESEVDIFGLPIEYDETEGVEDIPDPSIPIGLEPEDMEEFWSQ